MIQSCSCVLSLFRILVAFLACRQDEVLTQMFDVDMSSQDRRIVTHLVIFFFFFGCPYRHGFHASSLFAYGSPEAFVDIRAGQPALCFVYRRFLNMVQRGMPCSSRYATFSRTNSISLGCSFTRIHHHQQVVPVREDVESFLELLQDGFRSRCVRSQDYGRRAFHWKIFTG
jgi:hypothetical protein